jgi:hypothetical protein
MMFIPDPNFPIPDPESRAKKAQDSGSGSTTQNLSIFNPEKLILSSQKRKIIRDFISYPGSGS